MTPRLGWILVLVVGSLTWANTLHNGFHYDDLHSIVNNVNIRSLDDPGRFLTDTGTFSVDADKGMFRPLLVYTFALNHSVGGYEVVGYHLVNIAIHLACALVVWWLAGLLGGGTGARTFAALLFAIHPVCCEPVNYISSRSESLSALFYLLGLCFFLRAERGPTALLLAAWLSLACGLLVKSTVFTLPAALVAADILVLRGWHPHGVWRRIRSHHIGGMAIACGYLLVVAGNGWLTRSLAQDVRPPQTQWLTQAKGLGYYLRLLVFPTGLSVEPQFSEQLAWSVVPILAVATCLSLLLVALCAPRTLRVGAFLIVWAGLYMLPTAIVPLNVLVNERRAYIPTAALFLGIGLLVQTQRRRRGVAALCIAATLVLALLSFRRNQEWKDDLALWTAAVREAPLMARPYLYLGNEHKAAAERAVEDAVARTQWRAAATAYAQVEGRTRDRDLLLRAANNLGAVHLGLALRSRGAAANVELEKAEGFFRQAVNQSPNFAEALVNLASCLLLRSRQDAPDSLRTVRLDETVELIHRALRIRPNLYRGHANLGAAYQALGQLAAAESSYRQALRLQPDDAISLGNLAGILVQEGDAALANGEGRSASRHWQEAETAATKALRLNARTPGASQVLEAARERLRRHGLE